MYRVFGVPWYKLRSLIITLQLREVYATNIWEIDYILYLNDRMCFLNFSKDRFLKYFTCRNRWYRIYASEPLGTGGNLGEMCRRAHQVRLIGFLFFSRGIKIFESYAIICVASLPRQQNEFITSNWVFEPMRNIK